MKTLITSFVSAMALASAPAFADAATETETVAEKTPTETIAAAMTTPFDKDAILSKAEQLASTDAPAEQAVPAESEKD